MPLRPGDQLGSYQIVAPLGAGGMGEVYRARDSKLNRDVAIKVLPAALAKDADYLARFQREAQALAALQHPNIASIFGLEGNAIVMELVEGQTLLGPLPLAAALPIAQQIAEALEAAHDKGIIHRDLKPGNILITADGVVKVLDFGLAKAVERTTDSSQNSPTLTMRATEAGLILGTAGYMSPEQAAGKPVDRRADIWSFGVVFWELLTGKRLFDGETISHTLAEVLKEPIDLTLLPAGPVRDLISRCLDRNLKTRLQHIGEARIALENYHHAPPAPPVKPLRMNWALTAALVLTAIGITGFTTWRLLKPAPQPLLNLNLNLGPDALIEGTNRNATFDLSADGRALVYIAKGPAGLPQLALRKLDQALPVLLAGTEDPSNPFFSPDGEWIAFNSGGKLKKVLAAGGLPINLCDAPSLRGGTWDAEGNIIAALDIRGALSLVPGAGGAPKPFTTLIGNEATHRWPQALPGGAGILFISSMTPGSYESAVIEFASPKGERKVVHRGGYGPRYVATGDLLFMSQGNLLAAPLNLARMELTRSPSPVLYDVDTVPFGGLAPLAVSANGMLLYRSGAGERKMSLGWVDRDGKIDRLPLKAAHYRSFAISPNGKRIIITESGTVPVSIYDIDRDVLTRLQFRAGGRVVWTPDGRQLVFGNAEGLSLASADGSGSPRRLTNYGSDRPSGWHPDGSVLYFLRNSQLWRLPMNWSEGGISKPGPPERVEGVGSGRDMTVSPDGRWAAAEKSVPGSIEAMVYSLAPGETRQWQVSADGGFAPTWSPRGNELFYARSDGQLVVVPYSVQGGTFVPGKPEKWTVPPLVEARRSIETSPDGKRYLAAVFQEAEKAGPKTEMVLLLNFFDELKRRASGAK